MANTYKLIASTTYTSSGSRIITFSSIPATYTDLLLRVSARSDTAATTTQGYFWISYPTGGTGSSLRLIGSGSAVSSTTFSGAYQAFQTSSINAASSTANTFSSVDCYIPNYLSSNNKSVSIDGATEDNSSSALIEFTAGLINTTSAITSVSFEVAAGNLVTGTTAYLYGISNA